jgi:hypothetical protein
MQIDHPPPWLMHLKVEPGPLGADRSFEKEVGMKSTTTYPMPGALVTDCSADHSF